jgi:hypothetical protein
MNQTMVTVLIGENKKAYTFHRALLVHYSEYRRTAFIGSFKEAEGKRIHLSDIKRASC